MTKKRHGALLTALTLVLGIAILTTAIAVPQLRPVQNIDAVEVQTLETAAGAQGAQTDPVRQAMQSPAYIPLVIDNTPAAIPSDWIWAPGDKTPMQYTVEQHNKTNGLDNGTRTNWYDPAPIQLDVFSSYEDPVGHLDYVRDPALPMDPIIVPGTQGTYSFTLSNLEPGNVEYLLNISEGPETNRDFPVIFFLKDDRGDLTTTWMDLDTLEAMLFIDSLAVSGTRKFTLDWKWEFERGAIVDNIASGDPEDTGIGKDVIKGYSPQTVDQVPYYQVQLNLRLRGPDDLRPPDKPEKPDKPGLGGLIPLPIPIPLPLIPLVLPCLKCLKPCDKCTCSNCNCAKPKTEPMAKTGDSTMAAYSALTMLVISGGIAAYLYRKRREEEE